jgi:hypothetical protein
MLRLQSLRHRVVPALCLTAIMSLHLAHAQTNAPATAAPSHTRCLAPEQRQFDFWIGRWTVYDTDGSLAGENTIERIDDGCVLIERWRGAEGMTGTSLNSWHAPTRQWHQHWVDSRGGLLRLSGGLDGPRMVLTGASPHPGRPGATVQDRITWTPAADGAVRQLWERSEDAGLNWAVVFDGRYVRQP